MRLIRKLKTFLLRYSLIEKWNVLLIFLYLIKVIFTVKIVPLKYYYSNYFTDGKIQRSEMQSFSKEVSLIKKVLRSVPFSVTCLMESMVVKLYLKHININIPIFLGIQNNDEFRAHAWNFESKDNIYKIINIQR